MATVSIVGRPNVGKSALFNRIARERIAIVFDRPGVTRDRVAREVTVLGKRFMLVDTGGIAFDKTPGSEDPFAEETRAQAALAVGDSDLCVVVVDVRSGITPLDEEVLKRVRESGCPTAIAAKNGELPPKQKPIGKRQSERELQFMVMRELERGTGIYSILRKARRFYR